MNPKAKALQKETLTLTPKQKPTLTLTEKTKPILTLTPKPPAKVRAIPLSTLA